MDPTVSLWTPGRESDKVLGGGRNMERPPEEYT